MWEALNIHPSEWDESHWQAEIDKNNIHIVQLNGHIDDQNKVIEELQNGQLEARTLVELEIAKQTLRDVENNLHADAKERLEAVEQLANLYKYLRVVRNGELSASYQKTIAYNNESLKQAVDTQLLLQDKNARITYAENLEGTNTGAYIDGALVGDYDTSVKSKGMVRRYNEVKKHPEWMEKVYLYVAVGESAQPDMTGNYPSPSNFDIKPEKKDQDRGYFVNAKGGNDNTGFILRHEVGHHTDRADERFSHEANADQFAIDTLTDAWQRYQRGDDTGYYFVFATPDGIIYTKDLEPRKNEQLVF